ncbi:hypothetical protein ACFC1T_16950 [Kitasatospora sp. NPDC056076]|uniref:hypothetical protein n=1 Tax=Kitasatospora sp. NPDC056076 TaxID=3345703 RepID=UPI0035D76D68
MAVTVKFIDSARPDEGLENTLLPEGGAHVPVYEVAENGTLVIHRREYGTDMTGYQERLQVLVYGPAAWHSVEGDKR